ncbi:hypothetical protein EV702DRAFT_1077646 [Suillus placidus]|uniref:DUF6532 domain-containing protein n=1 Tax=Suillus placidus TaxID=48579 RepID=A0A9P7A108_9AGAM|nr:hypothetical protein EV702DRAFT_1077646 [Suillus placidus]
MHNTSTNLNVHRGDYLAPSDNNSQHDLHMAPPLHSFPERHNVNVHPSGHGYDFTVSHGMNDPPPPSDTYHPVVSHTTHNFQPVMSNDVSHRMNDPPPPSDTYHSVASHSSNKFQPAMSNDVYYFMRPDDSNIPQALSDPMPEVTTKLARGTSRKNKRVSSTRMKFLSSKQIAQESSLTMTQASSSLVFLPPMFLRDFKEDARISMIKALFDENLFPSVDELSVIAKATFDTTVTRFTSQDATHGPELIRWKSGSEAKSCLARLKGVLKEIHGDFEEVAVISWISAYELSLNIWNTRNVMYATRVADLTALLADYLFADKIVEVTMDDGQILSRRTPFAHTAIVDMIEYVMSHKQYSRYISLNTESWIPRLTNAVALAATSCAWSLEKALAGPWSAAGGFQTEANRLRYKSMKSRLNILPMDERTRFNTLLVDMRRALW